MERDQETVKQVWRRNDLYSLMVFLRRRPLVLVRDPHRHGP
jgi:hypothetical protein